MDFDGTQQPCLVLQPVYSIDYQPGESRCTLFGGNSNWRGPVWMPGKIFVGVVGLELYDPLWPA